MKIDQLTNESKRSDERGRQQAQSYTEAIAALENIASERSLAIDALRAELLDRKQDIQLLESKKDQIDAAAALALRNLEAEREKTRNLTGSQEQLASQLAELQKQLRENGIFISSQQSQLSLLEQAKLDLEAQLLALKSDLVSCNRDLDEFHLQKKRGDEESSKKITDLEYELFKLQSNATVVQEENQELKAQVEDLQNKLDELNYQLETSKENALANARKSEVAHRFQLAAKEGAITSLKQQMADFVAIKDALKEQLSELNVKCATQLQLIDDQKSTVDSLKQQASVKDANIAALQEQLAQLTAENDAIIKDLQEQVAKLSAEKNKMIEALQQQVAEKDSAIGVLRDQIDELTVKNDGTNNSLQDSREKLEESSKHCALLEAALLQHLSEQKVVVKILRQAAEGARVMIAT